MKRDDLILYFEDIVESLVRKYNNGIMDEDLKSIAFIKVIKAVDKSLEQGTEPDPEKMKCRVIVWVKNELIQAKKKKVAEPYDDLDILLSDTSYDLLLIHLKSCLEPKELEVFDFLLEGFNKSEILKILNISVNYYNKLRKSIIKKIFS